MKRVFTVLLTICLLLNLPCFSVKAHSSADALQVGDIFETPEGQWKTITAMEICPNGGFLLETRTVTRNVNRGFVTQKKDYYYGNNSGEILWKATLTGTFSYNGVSASCTSASCTTTVYNSSWSEKTNHAYPSGASAMAEVTMVQKFLFITVDTVSVNLVLICDKDGNVS